jgi:hypothetical protein
MYSSIMPPPVREYVQQLAGSKDSDNASLSIW